MQLTQPQRLLTPLGYVFARATWSSGRVVRYSTDRFASGLGALCLMLWIAMVPLVWVGPYSALLALTGALLLLRCIAQWRLRHVAARLEATGTEEEIAAATAVPTLMGRYCAWAASHYDGKVQKLAARATTADESGDEFKAWDLRRRAQRKQERADQARSLIDDWQ